MGVISTNVHITSRGTTLQGGSLPFCAGIGGCSATWITWCRLTDWGDVVDEMIRHVMHMYMIMCNYIYIYIFIYLFFGGIFWWYFPAKVDSRPDVLQPFPGRDFGFLRLRSLRGLRGLRGNAVRRGGPAGDPSRMVGV